MNPELPEGHLALGYSFYRIERDYDRALHELKIAQAALPNDSEIFLVLGSIARRQGNWTQSVADYQKGLSLNPKSAFLWMCLGGTHRAVRDFAAAARAYAKGAEIDPAFFMNRYYQARLEIEWRGDTKPMEQLLSAAPKADPQGRVLFARYELAIFQRRFEEALRLVAQSKLEKLAPYEPPAPVPRSSLVAKACRYLGRDDEARAAFGEAAQAIESSPEVNSAWRAVFLGQAYAGLGRTEDAIREAHHAGELLPESRDAFEGPAIAIAVTEIYSAVGETDEAIKLLEHSLLANGGVTAESLRLNPAWDSLRGDPRFQRLAAEEPVK